MRLPCIKCIEGVWPKILLYSFLSLKDEDLHSTASLWELFNLNLVTQVLYIPKQEAMEQYNSELTG